MQKDIAILGQIFTLQGDTGYLGAMGDEFEPATCALLSVLCENDNQVIDIGANIGMTSIALSLLCSTGKVAAIEPVPNTYAILENNLRSSDCTNVSLHNVAAGSETGEMPMIIDENNLSVSFVIDIDNPDLIRVPVRPLDDMFTELHLERLDFLKIDVEGFELEALAGAASTLERFKPRVLLEMNHWCLNIFRRMSIPEFHERLLKIFPVVFVVDGAEFMDFRNDEQVGSIYHNHVVDNRFMNVVAGWDEADILNRLQQLESRLAAPPAPASAPSHQPTPVEHPPGLLHRVRRLLRGQ